MSSRDAVLVSTSFGKQMIAPDGDAGVIRIILLQPHFTYNHGVADFLLFADQDVVLVYKKEGVSACNPFCVGGGT